MPLVGENGSGKSTLLGIASGFVDPDLGHGPDRGPAPAPGLPGAGQEAGSGHGLPGHLADPGPAGQEQPLPRGPGQTNDRRFWRRKRWARRVLAEFDLDLELFPDAPAGFLTLADRQLFEVAKALVTDPKVLLLDEPTTALGPTEVEALHRTVIACRERGVGVVYVSHRLPEVLEVADRITVLRDGRSQGTFDARDTTESALVELIVGRPFEAAFPPASPDGRRAARGPPRRRPAGSVLRSGQFRDAAWRDRRCRRRRGQRPARALRLPGRPATAASGSCRLRRHGADAHLDPRGGAVRDHAAPGRPQARGVDAGARGPGQCDRPDVASVQRDGRAPSPTGAQDRAGTGRSTRDPHAVARAACAVPVRRQPAEGGRGAIVPQGSDRRSSRTSRRKGSTSGSRFDIYAALRSRTDAGAALLVKSSDPLELAGSVRPGARDVPRPDHRGDPRRGTRRASYRRGHRARTGALQGRAIPVRHGDAEEPFLARRDVTTAASRCRQARGSQGHPRRPRQEQVAEDRPVPPVDAGGAAAPADRGGRHVHHVAVPRIHQPRATSPASSCSPCRSRWWRSARPTRSSSAISTSRWERWSPWASSSHPS